MICYHCQRPVVGDERGDGREYQLRKPLPGGDSAHLGESRSFHRGCQRDWWRGLVDGYADLDRACNDCIWWVRQRGKGQFALGRYIRDGQEFSVGLRADWCESENTLPPAFIAWLNKRGWWPGWWRTRRSLHPPP